MTYRILSLDGGGTWALIEIKALMEIYGATTTGRTVLQDFDLVAANSGGSIVLGGLVEDFTLEQLLDFFEDETQRRSVFSKTESRGDLVLHGVTGIGPKYSAENKLPALQHVFTEKGNLTLDRAVAGLTRHGSQNSPKKEDVNLLIVGFDYDRNRATFFRSAASTGPAWGRGDKADVTLAEAIHASTNAPVNYFDAPAAFPDRPGRYWDGAISGNNNPVLAAVTEAIVKGQNPTDIVALSLGTASVALPWPQEGQPPSPFVQQIADPSLLNDFRKLATSILDDPPDIATFLAHVLTGSGAGLNTPQADSRIVRMNPLISPVKNPGDAWSAPGSMTAAQFTFLVKLDMDAVEQPEVDAISKYADLWIENVAPNQPLRMDGDTLQRELGQSTFQAALGAWNAIKG